MWREEKFDRNLFGRRYNFIFCDGFSEETLICKKTPGSSVGILRVQWNILRDEIPEEKNLSNFWELSENLLGFWENKTGRVAKTAFYVSRTTFGVNWAFFQKKMHF